MCVRLYNLYRQEFACQIPVDTKITEHDSNGQISECWSLIKKENVRHVAHGDMVTWHQKKRKTCCTWWHGTKKNVRRCCTWWHGTKENLRRCCTCRHGTKENVRRCRTWWHGTKENVRRCCTWWHGTKEKWDTVTLWCIPQKPAALHGALPEIPHPTNNEPSLTWDQKKHSVTLITLATEANNNNNNNKKKFCSCRY